MQETKEADFTFTVAVAMSPSRVMGSQGKLPWNIPEDLAHFKEITLGKTVVMGRKTWESLPLKNRPLPGRINVVVSRKGYVSGYRQPDHTVTSLTDLYKVLPPTDIVIIGGSEIYNEAYLHLKDRIQKLHITLVHKEVDGDVLFPAQLLEGIPWETRTLRRVIAKCGTPLDYLEFTRPT